MMQLLNGVRVWRGGRFGWVAGMQVKFDFFFVVAFIVLGTSALFNP